MAETLYEKVGGEEAISKVVDYFYNELVLKDDTVNHFFQQTDMEKQREHQAKFISFDQGAQMNIQENRWPRHMKE